MSIIFHHPPTGTANPFADFRPWDSGHYPPEREKGVYIYGIRARVDGHMKFIPIVVGEGVLHTRLFKDHYLGKFANPLSILLGDRSKKSGDAKELWDFSKSDLSVGEIVNIYKDIDEYDNCLRKKNKLNLVSQLQNLIFFRDRDFFHLKHLPSVPLSGKRINLKAEESIDYLIDTIACNPNNNSRISQHVKRILSTLGSFRDRFYYVYASNANNPDRDPEIDFTNKGVLRSIEKQTKEKLKTINIQTSAGATPGVIANSIDIDLSIIQKELVNVGGHSYNDVTGNYVTPLIL